MTKKELLDILGLEDGSEFSFFENMADLLEYDEEIPAEALAPVLAEADMEVFTELVETYFQDLSEHMPDQDVDIYNILEAEKRTLTDLARGVASGEENGLHRLADELERFHGWYSLTDNCVCTDDETGVGEAMPVRDAVGHYRLSKMDGRSLSFDFDEALRYEVDDYIVTFGELTAGDVPEDGKE